MLRKIEGREQYMVTQVCRVGRRTVADLEDFVLLLAEDFFWDFTLDEAAAWVNVGCVRFIESKVFLAERVADGLNDGAVLDGAASGTRQQGSVHEV